MNLLLWIVFGGLVGWLASAIVGTPQNLVWDIVVGILGSLLGGWLGQRLSGRSTDPEANRPTSLGNFLWALLGAVILIALINLVLR